MSHYFLYYCYVEMYKWQTVTEEKTETSSESTLGFWEFSTMPSMSPRRFHLIWLTSLTLSLVTGIKILKRGHLVYKLKYVQGHPCHGFLAPFQQPPWRADLLFISSFQISFRQSLCWKCPRAKWKYVSLSPLLQRRVSSSTAASVRCQHR